MFLLVHLCSLLTGLLCRDISDNEIKVQNSFLNQTELSDSLIDHDYLLKCQRLNIQYKDYPQKALIGTQIPPNFIEAYKKDDLMRIFSQWDDHYTKIILDIDPNTTKDIYFKDTKFISTDEYFKSTFYQEESTYFRFFYSDSSRINQESKAFLDNELEKMIVMFSFALTDEKINLLKKNKIDYIICKDMDEMKEITGFETNGIALLNDDTVVSIDPSHFHEVVHIMMNFLVSPNYLYTHQLLQEGVAVALGGRSGRSAQVMKETGVSLFNLGYITPDLFLNHVDFAETDPSISYSAGSVMVDYLIKERGAQEFLNMYQRYSCSQDQLSQMLIQKSSFNLNAFSRYMKQHKVIIPVNEAHDQLIINTPDFQVYQVNDHKDFFYVIMNSGYFSSTQLDLEPIYQSRIWKEHLIQYPYQYQKYFLSIDENDIKLYDLHLDRLICSISNGFSEEVIIKKTNDQKISFVSNDPVLKDLLLNGQLKRYQK